MSGSVFIKVTLCSISEFSEKGYTVNTLVVTEQRGKGKAKRHVGMSVHLTSVKTTETSYITLTDKPYPTHASH